MLPDFCGNENYSQKSSRYNTRYNKCCKWGKTLFNILQF